MGGLKLKLVCARLFEMIESVTLRGKCPICGRGAIQPLPLDYFVFVAKDHGTQRVGGLTAYQCTQELHIFFVLSRDVEIQRELNTA
jgi:hypothetical protein